MMKTTMLLMMATAFIQTASAKQPSIDIDIHGSRSDYESLLQEVLKRENPFYTPGPYRSLEPIVKLGKRNLDWLDHLNKFRENRLSFTSEKTQGATPIETPNKYGPKTVIPAYDNLANNVPKNLNKILFSDVALPNTLPTDDDTYLTWAIQINKTYQTTVRWLALSKWLSYYERRKQEDIRGYHFLKSIANLDEILQSGSLTAELTSWLINLCESGNSSYKRCKSKFNMAKKQQGLVRYKNTHWSRAKNQYDSNFTLDVHRGDVTWDSPQHARVLFRSPESNEIKAFLADNIEDEWQWNDWKLTLDFKSNARIHVKFLPNVVPQVDGLGGNRILMNSLDSLEEYNTRWTIRHEFGHVMGFPDCYVEYYDSNEELMVNYQIDISNLMCSRRGKFKATHLNELKRVYRVNK